MKKLKNIFNIVTYKMVNSIKNTFYKDLNFGKKYENLLLNYIEYEEFEMAEPNIKFSDWDVKTINNSTITKYEVKASRISYSSGYIFLEYTHRYKNSGILTTKSDYYAYFVVKSENEHDLYLIPTSVLLDMFRSYKYRSIQCGYNKLSSCILIPLMELSEYLLT